MSEAYVGEIKMWAGTKVPNGWALCSGQLLAISQFPSLYDVIGTTYGGDGNTTFALPDLRGRIPLHQGPGYDLGQSAGAEEVTLSVAQIPQHNHFLRASSQNALQTSPEGNVLAQATSIDVYRQDTRDLDLAEDAVLPAGGGAAHTNVQPFLCINYIIALSTTGLDQEGGE